MKVLLFLLVIKCFHSIALECDYFRCTYSHEFGIEIEMCYSINVPNNCALYSDETVRSSAHTHSSVLNSSNYVAMQAKADMELRLFVSKVEPNLAKVHTVGGCVHVVYGIQYIRLYFVFFNTALHDILYLLWDTIQYYTTLHYIILCCIILVTNTANSPYVGYGNISVTLPKEDV